MTIDAYVHADKESMYQLGRKHGLRGEALELFKYAACEVKVTLNVNPKTGDAEIVAVDNRPLKEQSHE